MSIALESKSFLDILHSQTENPGSGAYHIPIKKIKFEDITKPTDIELWKEEAPEQKIEINKSLEKNEEVESKKELTREERVEKLKKDHGIIIS